MDSTDVEITVNLNPKRLADSSLVYCQTINGKEELNFLTDNRTGEILKIKWFTENNTELFSENELPSINTSNDSVYAIYAKQINSTTGCESELATIKINILPQIEVPTIDSTTCQPNIINLEKLGTIGVSAKEYSKNIIIESIGVTNETDRSIVTPINNSTQISESGIYRIFYNYTLGDVTCRNTTDAKLTFLQQPQKPSIANQSFCQNTGEVELAGTPSYTNLRLIWEDLSVYPSRIDTNTTTVSTELATEKSIKVRHIQDNSGCISADTIIRVKILPELIAMDLDTSICYGESVNLREMVENNHRNNPLINNIQFKNLDAMQFDEKKVENTSLYQAYFSDASGVCRDTSLVQINVNNPVEITLEGATPSICAQEVIQITASGADNYKWNEFNEGATFTLKTTTPQKMQINLRAKQAFKEICCYKDSTISIEVMPAVEPLILTYDTCSKSKITTDLIKSKFNISENIDSIWYYDAAIRRDNISKVLEDEGNYQLLATNQYGCKAIHNMKVNMYNVGKLAIENDNSKIYCYNDTITFKATSENESKFTWKNSDNDSILYQGNNYWDSLKANTNLTLIASEVVMGCKDSISFTVNVREQTPIIVSVTSKKGETNVCKGDTIKLAVEGLNSVSWLYNDTIIDSNSLEIIGEKTTKIYAWGRDINNCQTNTEKVEINVATLSKPIIKTTEYSDEYDLSKEKTNIALYADGNTNNGQITYQWQIGNEIMHSSTENSFSHTFSDETIHLNKDIEVNLYLEHEYGCKASASRILTIDPYLYVPNTLLYGHGIIFMEDYDLQIYDRVGTLIHEGKGWDGTYKGRPAIADTYFYSLMYYIKGEKQFKTGYITLVR
jgi:gliding motility-associated-like protein